MEPTPDASIETPAIDRVALVGRCMDDAGFACVILGKFQKHLGESVRKIEDAAAAGDVAATGRAAHALKGAAANLSADVLAAVAATIEAAGEHGDLAAVGTALPALRAEVARCAAHVPLLIAELQRAAA